MSTYHNPNSTQFQLIFDSTSCQPHFNLSLNINLNSTLTLTSTQYGCDIKATKSCINNSFVQAKFNDVCLTSEDGSSTMCNSLLLRTISPFVSSILDANCNIIFFHNIHINDILALLSLMYS